MTSIHDVAARAGVSVATVSRALRDLPRVSEDTRQRVQQAATDLGYAPSPAAAGLAGGRTRTVGVVVPYVTRWFFSSVVQGIESVLSAREYDLLLYELGGARDARERLFRRHLNRKRVDGLVVLSLALREDERERLAASRLPVTLVGAAGSGLPSVGIDDVAVARQATAHLLGLGHQRIALMCGSDDDPVSFTPRDRRRGFRREMRRAGLDVEPQLDVEADFTVASGRAAMARLLALRQPPTAVLAASDEMAMGCLHAARQHGVTVPAELSVVGIDDHELSEVLDLTTVAQPARAQGRIAAEMLLDVLAGDRTVEPVARAMPTHLVVRGTTGPAPGGTLRPAPPAAAGHRRPAPPGRHGG